jgi:Flp pilus assembly protein protease CpaA
MIASVWDLKFNKKIPNALIFLGLASGISISTYYGGWGGFLSSLTAIIFTQIICMLFWGAIAAGDIKLIMVIASFMGMGEALYIGLMSFLIGGIAFTILKPKRAIYSIKSMIYFIFYTVPIKPVSKTQSVAFSPFIFAAFLLAVFV